MDEKGSAMNQASSAVGMNKDSQCNSSMGSITTSYNITTIKTKPDGSKVVKVENKPDDPQLARDPTITGSQKMLVFARAQARNNS